MSNRENKNCSELLKINGNGLDAGTLSANKILSSFLRFLASQDALEVM